MTDFAAQLQEKVTLIERELAHYLKINAPTEPKLAEAVQWAVSGGGKRIRPVLTLAFAELCGAAATEAIPFALAVEFIHSYSLVHDDLPSMDNADTRRGKASVHKQFGEATALLAGDALLTEALAALASNADVHPAKVAMACKVLAAGSGAQGGMVSGQYTEMVLEGAEKITERGLNIICAGKTAALLETACRLGVIAGQDVDAPIELYTSLQLAAQEYGHGIGLAFQMIDDVFDIEEDTAAGRTTFATLLGEKRTRAKAAKLTRKAKEALAVFGGGSFLAELADRLLMRE
ncbi:MAG: polyprenyl synthetase family protein [Oscillospiraceae bacterium]|jgi:geranylgeranyl diphosphate synthase type II|nr:polyprenyl synthetase family protein [Oscillospiraceae bacterium]